MKTLRLPFGRGELSLKLQEQRILGILAPEQEPDRRGDQREILREALAHPVGSRPLRELARGMETIVIITSDHTRPLPSRITLPPLLGELRRGNPGARIRILVATGNHRPTDGGELREKFGNQLLDDEEIVVHDSRDDTRLTDVGRLPSGGRLVINRLAAEADLLLSEGFVEPHFFAGFSGGRKSVLPGIAGWDTVLANHCAEFIDHPRARTGMLSGNPIHREMVHAARKVRLRFSLNVLLDSHRRVTMATCGKPGPSHRAACDRVRKLASVRPVEAKIVVTTNGGYPLDRNIYQTVKCMTAAEATCRPGGVIVAVAECRDGHGGRGFHDLLSRATSPSRLLAGLRRRGRTETLPDQWEAQILARILSRHEVILVTAAPREMVEGMHMSWAPDPSSALEMAAEKLGKSGAGVTVIPDGVGLIIEPAQAPAGSTG